ncbi:MAG: 2,5-diketo-D-gluconate reductase [Frankiales bacterium]|jgi:diketogulonate reductase-like aldo/keto reductase|nr:2,5-diketo-D-gluconate reductase [Frankiales bacterium]MDX6214363.1 2,5-diketo-D-gluconate reductase [Frankiales bacterium]MDX6221707.1 2,5-diketo-D-gluconate reductase [Frankiales bacterium]
MTAISDLGSAPLSSGGSIPLVGFGTWQLSGTSARESTAAALDAGYRHIDTATGYANEAEVGAALRDSGVPRGEVFVTTKLPPDHGGRERRTLEESLAALGVDQVDLWLIHWPPGGAGVEMWRELIRAQQDGLARAIGVSNYSLDQIDELNAATGVTPAVNQIKWGPFLHDAKIFAGHQERGVVLEGYSPFRSGSLKDPTLVAIAAELGRTVPQVIVRWHVQHGIVVIPKSARPERIVSNVDVTGFTLSDAQMTQIDALGRG